MLRIDFFKILLQSYKISKMVKFSVEQTTKAQKASRVIALFFL